MESGTKILLLDIVTYLIICGINKSNLKHFFKASLNALLLEIFLSPGPKKQLSNIMNLYHSEIKLFRTEYDRVKEKKV